METKQLVQSMVKKIHDEFGVVNPQLIIQAANQIILDNHEAILTDLTKDLTVKEFVELMVAFDKEVKEAQEKSVFIQLKEKLEPKSEAKEDEKEVH